MKSFSDLDNLGTSSPQIIPPIHPSAALAGQRGASGAFAKSHQIIAVNMTNRCTIAAYLKESHPSWQYMVSRNGYGILLDAIAFQVSQTKTFNHDESRQWLEAITKLFKNKPLN